MIPSDSSAAFASFISDRGVALSNSTPRDGFEHMLLFYQSVIAAGCAGPDGDMLLFQWGTYDWGHGHHFEINITRQFIEQALEDDDAISQLSLTYRYPPTPGREALGAGNRWCGDRAELAAFQAFALSSPPLAADGNTPPADVELDHSYV